MTTLDEMDRARMDAEAAAWLARLQGDDRTLHTDAGFKTWLEQDSGHQDAFARATNIWDHLPGAHALSAGHGRRTYRGRPDRKAPVLLAAAASVVAFCLLGGYAYLTRPVMYETLPGQQLTTTLRDGSRISLNTDSQISVRFSGGYRRVTLKRGEVLFDVAHNASHPFLVEAGDEQVRDIGTSFLMRRDGDDLAVTLLKGKVELSRRSRASGDSFVPQMIMAPGERATIDRLAQIRVDKPTVENMTAWRHGQVIFTNVSLLEAANELNRYGPVKIVVNDPRVARLRVSGVFETHDAAEFAALMAQLNGLTVRREGQTIELTN
ncbi:FecR domain-containing protein [Asticcacaulis sp. EMRT-3]|uniref:FecR family protein n=1 Tax=Asticcacaulis sp. EMRT-3 TaxID=3040349 RepID=UPI0024AFB392|nr:FecR domain-containing protein [Asticcacaulis sp. EMRT-3]MDI7776499.1 FecR domain-containing protein [Asticcacaulis sp. EMRT-3]